MAAAVGAIVWFVAPHWMTLTPRSVAAYDAFAMTLLALLWFIGTSSDSKIVAARAASRDPGRNLDLMVAISCVLVGLTSALIILGKGPSVTTPSQKAFEYALGITAVIVGWFIIHTLFLFRYAHLYYYDDDDDQEADRGMTFPNTETPGDTDFAYFSFVIGMTFQVSDVVIVDSGVRRVALIHALISFAYNTLIVALCINILSGLLH